MNIRVKFNKHGVVRYIGHLDVMRFFQKVLRRAEIDVAYTGGFSPHQIMTFASPLGVGLESNGEYMDLRLNSMTTCQDIMDRINRASVPGIQAVAVTILPEDAPNAMASVAAAEYYVSFREGRTPRVFETEDKQAVLDHFMEKETIPFTKETKKGTRTIDLKTGIYCLEWDAEEEAFHMLLNASSGDNIKPIQVLEVLLSEYEQTLENNALLITREDIYTNIGTEEAPKLVPLSRFGQES